MFSPGAPAAIVSIAARAEVRVEQYRGGVFETAQSSALDFPGAPLPLQAVAGIVVNGEDAAALGGAQFAEPIPEAPNPEEIALNLTCDSLSPELSFVATGSVGETREIIFSSEETGRPTGTRAGAVGRLTLDGALAIYATDAGTDLSGTEVSLFIHIEQRDGPEGDVKLLSGQLLLVGLSGGEVRLEAAGDFPTTTLILTDLTASVDELGVFYVLIIPNVVVRYDYETIIGTPFTLDLKTEIVVHNLPNGVGAVGMLGSPTDSLLDVMGSARGPAAAAKMLDAVQREREHPTGPPAFPADVGFQGCGVIGLEATAGLLGLTMVGCVGPGRRLRDRARKG
jgi:hypothetical protein